MLDTFDARFGLVSLSGVLFFEELFVFLGVSRGYVRRLVSGGLAKSDPVYARLAFPSPWFVSASGVRVWRVSDVEAWVLAVRCARGGGVNSVGGLLFERRDVGDLLLGAD